MFGPLDKWKSYRGLNKKGYHHETIDHGKPENKALKDLSVREIFVLLPISIMIFVMVSIIKPKLTFF